MKILYVGDNRNRSNWGCRATSMALGSILYEAGDIAGVINGKEVGHFSMTPVPWGGLKPAALWRRVDAFPLGRFSKHRQAIKRKCGISDDFVDECPDRSVRRFLNIYKTHHVLNHIFKQVESTDVLVVNGEGTYIYSIPPRRDTLFYNFILRLGQSLGKKTYVLNAMFSDCPKSGRNEIVFRQSLSVFEQCNAVSARDPQSFEVLRTVNTSANINYYPDALFTWHTDVQQWASSVTGRSSFCEPFGDERYGWTPSINFDHPYICLGGSSSAAWSQEAAFDAYLQLAKALSQLNCQLLITPTCDGDAFLVRVASHLGLPYLPVRTPIRLCAGVVGKAEVFISGRFHPSILASGAGTSCIFLGSNSHKTLSLQEMLEYEAPFEFQAIPSEEEVQQITTRTQFLLDDNRRERIKEVVARRSAEAKKVLKLLKR